MENSTHASKVEIPNPAQTHHAPLKCDQNLNLISHNFDTAGPANCTQAMLMAESTASNAYAIKEPNNEATLKSYFCAYCHYEESGSWLVIQRRQDGSENFNRNWADYLSGFGDVNGEFWLGLERIHQLTKNGNHELWVSLKDFDGNERNAYYKKFEVATEGEKYRLTIGNYSGDAGDSMSYNDGRKFTTYDQDNDDYIGVNCGELFKGGWWYLSCSNVKLNAPYSPQKSSNAIMWDAWHGPHESLKYVHMAIRPAE